MNEYMVTTRIVVSANSEDEAREIIKNKLYIISLTCSSLRFIVVNARKCTRFLSANAFLQKGYSHPHITTE